MLLRYRGETSRADVTSVRLRHLPGRLTTGVFIVNSGLSKPHADDDTAAALHGMAAVADPFLHAIPPQRFVRLVCAGELALGMHCSFLSYPP
jgi:hypothetical protein